MRMVNPEQLQHLARLLNDRGGVTDDLTAAFTRTRQQGVTDRLAALKPLHHWVDDTAVDLRRRAGYAYLEDGKPMLALATWAGGGTKDAKWRSKESLADWEDRIKPKILTLIPGLAPLGAVGDAKAIVHDGGLAVFHGINMTKILAGNSLREGWLGSLKNNAALSMQNSDSVKVRWLGTILERVNPALRSL
ncbi:hypothetical protein [Streptomyces sp. NPDC005322]|uniref:hypothetical protein n=1 Tax=Streptomyces sp. NPDC005322 TaxID=3157032 RepID=UPI0033AC72DB